MSGVEANVATDLKDFMWAEACNVLERVEQMHRQFFRPGQAGMQSAAWQPPIDVFETADGLGVVVALPGVESQDIDVAIQQDVLVIAGIRHLPALVRGAAIQRLEIPYGRFERQIRLPPGRFELQQPELTNGCLLIALGKRR
jgi:HSP20 family molecular chaperone IbpA